MKPQCKAQPGSLPARRKVERIGMMKKTIWLATALVSAATSFVLSITSLKKYGNRRDWDAAMVLSLVAIVLWRLNAIVALFRYLRSGEEEEA